jgi:hypothetical protein
MKHWIEYIGLAANLVIDFATRKAAGAASKAYYIEHRVGVFLKNDWAKVYDLFTHGKDGEPEQTRLHPEIPEEGASYYLPY